MKEAKIVINGVTLSVGQSMTVRVLLSAVMIDPEVLNCGKDVHGRKMTKAYGARAREALILIHEAIAKGDTVEQA